MTRDPSSQPFCEAAGFLRGPPNGNLKKFFEFADKPLTQLECYDKEWWVRGELDRAVMGS